MGLARDGDLRLAVQDLHQRIERRRVIAMSLVDIYTHPDRNPVARRALESGTVEVKGDEAVATGSLDSALGVRAVTKQVRWSVEDAPWDDEARTVTICKNGQSVQIRACELYSCLAKGAHVGPCH